MLQSTNFMMLESLAQPRAELTKTFAEFAEEFKERERNGDTEFFLVEDEMIDAMIKFVEVAFTRDNLEQNAGYEEYIDFSEIPGFTLADLENLLHRAISDPRPVTYALTNGFTGTAKDILVNIRHIQDRDTFIEFGKLVVGMDDEHARDLLHDKLNNSLLHIPITYGIRNLVKNFLMSKVDAVATGWV